MSSSHKPDGADERDAGDVGALRARIDQLTAEIDRLRAAELHSSQREQQLTQHNLVLVNLSRSTSIERGELGAAFEEITLAAAHTLDVERASIWLFTPDRTAIKCLDLYQRGPNTHGNDLELKAADFPAYFRAVEDNRTLAVEQARTDPRTCEFDTVYLQPLGITSMLDAPVRRGGRLIGVICHEHVGEPRAWSLEDQAFAGSMADFVALTLQAHERTEALAAVRASEKQLRQIIDLVPHMILAKDARGQILLCNKAAAEAYATTVDRLIGRIQWDVHPRLDEAAAMLSDDLRVIEAGHEVVESEERFTDSAGRTRTLQTTKIPFMFSASREPAVLGVSIDVSQRKQDEHAKEMMIQELDHRVKNNLAVVMAIAEQTARGSKSIESFADAFAGRLRALAITHEMLAGAKWEGADMRGLVTRLAEPYARADGLPRVVTEGEALQLPMTMAPSVCMILHELATNAAKYGALSKPTGRVTLAWQREMHRDADLKTPWLHLVWSERGGPPVQPPIAMAANAITGEPNGGGAAGGFTGGFGTSFIQQTIAYQLRGRCVLDFAPGGLVATIDIPLERPTCAVGARPEPHEASAASNEGRGPEEARFLERSEGGSGAANGHEPRGAGRRILVVEDDHLVAQSIAGHLRSLGCEIVGPAATSDDACALVKSRPVDAAILDVNLNSGTSAPVARALAGRRTPFVFVTGYSSLRSLPDDLRGRRVLCKPVDKDSLGRALREMAGA